MMTILADIAPFENGGARVETVSLTILEKSIVLGAWYVYVAVPPAG
jgi:hypothetical protein